MRLSRLTIPRMRRDARGISAVEFGMLSPVFLGLIIGIGQMGILFQAQAGLRHAVAEGARFATVWVQTAGTPTPPQRPTNAQILARVSASKYGLNPSYITGPSISCPAGQSTWCVTGTNNGANYIDITMSYAVPLDFVFYKPPAVTLTETRRVYVNS